MDGIGALAGLDVLRSATLRASSRDGQPQIILRLTARCVPIPFIERVIHPILYPTENVCSTRAARNPFILDVLLESTEVDVELMERCQKGAEGCALGHLGKGVDILGEALATVTELAVGTGDIGVGVVDVAG